MIVDDIFRNINGIGRQMSTMEYIFTNGRQGLKKSPLPKLFQEVVELYNNNYEQYKKLLKEAKMMPEVKPVQNMFFTWLSEKVSPTQLSELYIIFDDIESFCVEKKILTKKLFETTDLLTIEKVIDMVNYNKVFRFYHKRNIVKIGSAIRMYYRFIQEHPELQEKLNSIETSEIKPKDIQEKTRGEISNTNSRENKDILFDKNETVLINPSVQRPLNFGETFNAGNEDLHKEIKYEKNISIQDSFFEWLSKKVSPRQLSDLYMAFPDIESFCLNRKILKQKLFETTELPIIKNVVDTVNFNRVFRFTFKGKLSNMSSAIKFYYQFVKEYPELQAQTEPDEEQKTNIKHPIQPLKREESDMNLRESKDTSFTQNVHHDEVKQKRIQLIEWMERHGKTQKMMINHLWAIGQCNKAMKKYNIGNVNLLAVQNIDELRRIKTLLFSIPDFQKLNEQEDILSLAFDVLLDFNLWKQSAAIKPTVQNRVKPNEILKTNEKDHEPEVKIKEWNIEKVKDENIPVNNSIVNHEVEIERVHFIEWMQKNGATLAVTMSYLSVIERCNNIIQKCIKVNLLTVKNVDELNRIKKLLFSSSNFKKMNAQQQKLFVVAFKKLIEYHSENNNVSIKTEVRTNIYDSTKEKSTIKLIHTEELELRCGDILKKYFNEDGYQIGRAIFRARFKQFYYKEYGSDIQEDDGTIDDILKHVGTQRDGRIFPKQNAIQNNLIEKIISDIVIVLDEGVSAVYLEAVYDKYKQQLAENLQIYHADALTSVLIENAKGRYVRRDSYLSARQNGEDSANDILRIMKGFHQPQTCDVIHDIAWYIPYDMMKILLARNKLIVKITTDTYFYVPNFPISEDELKQLTEIIQNELEYCSYITDRKMMELINEKCPSIAINTGEFTNVGLRKCLGCILREKFEVNGRIISKVGSQLNTSDVYTEFVKAYEILNFNELKNFSDEIKVSIYWDVVMREMVRISDKEMIRRDLISFDVDTIDAILDEICSENYIPLKDISLFLYFPNIGYPWNEYVLESYLYRGSRKFKLLHGSFSQDSVYGAMVRVDSPITNYQMLLVDVLANSNVLASPQKALQYIVDQGYQQRRRYDGIEQIIKEAKRIKEQREK